MRVRILAALWFLTFAPPVFAAPLPNTLTVTVKPIEVRSSVPRGSTRVPFMTLTLAASCEKDITLTSIELKHSGLGASSDISGVYAAEGIRRISRSAQFDAKSSRAVLRFRDVTIPKCDSITMDILASLSIDAATSGEHSITLTPNGVISSATYTDLANDKPSLTVETKPSIDGQISIVMLPVNTRLRYGLTGRAARVQLTSNNKAAHKLTSITFTNHGTARNLDLKRMYLENARGEILTKIAAQMDNQTVTLVFDPPFILQRSSSVVLSLKGEVRGSTSRTFQFTIDEVGDVVSQPVKR